MSQREDRGLQKKRYPWGVGEVYVLVGKDCDLGELGFRTYFALTSVEHMSTVALEPIE